MKRCLTLTLLLSLLLTMVGCGAVDIGVIGGEDGPTAVFTTGPDAADHPEAEPEPVIPDGEDPAPAESYEAEEPEEAASAPVDEAGTYNSAEDVSLYLYLYGHLPDNYITKSEARELGWSGGSVEQVAPGCAIGGDRFGNREGVLPDGSYHECDIDTLGQSTRGAKRLVYEDSGEIYYTEDHYESFTQLLFYTEEDGSLAVAYEGE